MFGLGPHAAFILASYLAVAITIAGLVAWLWFDGQRHQRRLDDLEARGLGRGSRFNTQNAPSEGP